LRYFHRRSGALKALFHRFRWNDSQTGIMRVKFDRLARQLSVTAS